MFTYDFFENTGKIKIKYSKKYRKQYVEFKDGFQSEKEYKEKLACSLSDFKHEMLNLPFHLSCKQARKTFLNNIYDELIITKELLDREFKKVLTKSFACITNQRKLYTFYYPRYFQKKYLAQARKSYQNIHIAYELQCKAIEQALCVLNTIAINDEIILKDLCSEPSERINTTLSSPELSFLFFVIFNRVSEDKTFNRTQLSKILAANFSTKKSPAPKANQIRKHFTDVGDNVKTSISTLFMELSELCNSDYL